MNPHLRLTIKWFGAHINTLSATDRAWPKWKPSDPTSPHWYGPAEFERLVAGYISHDRGTRTVREFVKEFRSLSGSAKQKLVLEATGLSHVPLEGLMNGSGLDGTLCRSLLLAMQENSTAVKPDLLGVIGRDHFHRRLDELNYEMESFGYRRITGTTTDGIPWVVEAAFAWSGMDEDEDNGRYVLTGINWSPAINNPFRDLGPGGSFDTLLERQRVHGEPVILALHLTCPKVGFTDRGKSAVALPSDIEDAIIEAATAVTAKWCKQRKREEREHSAARNRRDALTRSRSMSIKAAAWKIMPEAYGMAGTGGKLVAHARQIMYAARPAILQLTGKSSLDDDYFTQSLLPDYIAKTGVEWNVVFDARGSLIEPHTDERVPLGTLQVRNYVRGVGEHTVPEPEFDIVEKFFPTKGPKNRYQAILFIEKEGFMPLFEQVKLAERYDLAIMSTKGMSVVAARSLVDDICSKHDIPLLVLHDFDAAGFSILGTLRSDTRRYTYENEIRIIDLGLRIGDIGGLQDEAAAAITSPEKTRETLLRHGATEAEADYLLERRVELNAFTSEGLITWLEGKLKEHGIAKVVPDDDVVTLAYRRMHKQAVVQARIDQMLKEDFGQDDVVDVPSDLSTKIKEALKEDPELSWDEVLRSIVDKKE